MPAPRLSTARHPIRRAIAPAVSPRAPRRDDQDVKLFVLSFLAFFVCFYTMIF